MKAASVSPRKTSITQPGKGKADSPIITEILGLADEVEANMRKGIFGALRIGLRLIVLHRETEEANAAGGFRAALKALEGRKIPAGTAYRWINAASNVLATHQKVSDLAEVEIPAPGTPAWKALESTLETACKGMSLRRLIIGSAATSDESRQEQLITQAEMGDKHAEEMLDLVSKGELTLVQAIRAAAGKKTTKDKTRTDPVYLDIDGITGQPKGLFCKSLITITNTFSRWETLPETARKQVKLAWKELAANIPKELR